MPRNSSRNADIWTHGRNTDGDLFDSEHVPKSWDWREIGGLSRFGNRARAEGAGRLPPSHAVGVLHLDERRGESVAADALGVRSDRSRLHGWEHGDWVPIRRDEGGIFVGERLPCTPTRSRRAKSDRVERTRAQARGVDRRLHRLGEFMERVEIGDIHAARLRGCERARGAFSILFRRRVDVHDCQPIGTTRRI